MTKKSTILFPPILYRELQDAARQQGRSVGDLVREAVEIQYGSGGVAARLRAVDGLAQLDDEVPDDAGSSSRRLPGARPNGEDVRGREHPHVCRRPRA